MGTFFKTEFFLAAEAYENSLFPDRHSFSVLKSAMFLMFFFSFWKVILENFWVKNGIMKATRRHAFAQDGESSNLPL